MAALRTLVWRGGMTMAARQVAGMVISFAGLIVLARIIGPTAYGVYASAFALHTFLVVFFQWGTDVFLIRRPEDPTEVHVHQTLTLSLVLGGAGAVLAWPIGLAAQAWIDAEGIATAVTVLFLGMPLQLAALVPSALLQRRMAYTAVAWAELSGQVVLYGVAVTAALAGLGLMAPLAGWWVQQVVMGAMLFALARYRPRLAWRWDLLREVVRYGLGYAASIWLWQLRTLVNPLIVARVLGPEAAASVAIAARLVEALSFMRVVLWRVTFPALGRLHAEPGRLARAVSEGTRLQVLAVGLPMVAFVAVAPWLVPLAFGRAWEPVVTVFPYLATVSLVVSLFSLHTSAFYVLGRNRPVAVFAAVYVTGLFGLAAWLVPAQGLVGYGLAEVAVLITFIGLHAKARGTLGEVPIGLAMVWTAALIAPLFDRQMGIWAWAGPLFILLLPQTWREVKGWGRQLGRSASPRCRSPLN